VAKTKQVKETKSTYAARAARSNGARMTKTRPRKKVVAPERRVLGKYTVADPEICHGIVTFIGTRVFVADVLNLVAKNMPWDEIRAQYNGHISNEAIAEAVQLARNAFIEHVDKPRDRSLAL
jgi:uncharacterized protein (DUF433 family)